MFYLSEKAGLVEHLYRGGWKAQQRHGYGVQLFPNGARFVGNWRRNAAHGFGRLEFANHTYYEGNFAGGKLLEGRLQYHCGTYFEGAFDGERDVFKRGTLHFRDGERFEGAWSPEGVVLSGALSGALLTRDGRRLPLEGRDLVREPDDEASGKIVYWNKGLVYEGGLARGHYDKQGFVYGNYMHPFYFECNYEGRKYHGRYFYHSFFYGFATEEFYARGREVGTWRYQTVAGYEYVGDTSSKKQIVRFPFVNRDYYEGELKIWCERITLISGIYYMYERERADYKQIRVINCANISKHKDVVKRFNSFDEVAELIAERRARAKREFLSSRSGAVLQLGEGARYAGQTLHDYVVCHKHDLLELLSARRPAPRRRALESAAAYFCRTVRPSEPPRTDFSLVRVFRGVLLDGREHGYCQIVYRDSSAYSGFCAHGLKEGFGFYSVKDKFRFMGFFRAGKMHGQGLMYTHDRRVMRGNFEDGVMRGLGMIQYLSSNLEYFGQVLGNLRAGKGAIKFANRYKFEGFFSNDQIDTSAEKGVLIHRDSETVEEGVFVASTDLAIGFLQTDDAYYVFDFRKGVVRKTE